MWRKFCQTGSHLSISITYDGQVFNGLGGQENYVHEAVKPTHLLYQLFLHLKHGYTNKYKVELFNEWRMIDQHFEKKLEHK